ncbi:CwfJ domain protein [Penicillium waksmanii]|uniref:CwfJ domain protein n=1 Tax=Penicillium waksmanii TaxID=69791 RepID=UPI00254830E3|nr:CwfJ domain protein [Penicillium waksmanii]KAJ5988000.1 CwfJ domain protein [Penicillium waksmanii]
MASKIIVLGSVNCQLRAAFTKLAKLQVKQNFAFAILVGNLFGDCSTESELDEITALLSGTTSVPLPTYFTLGDKPLPTRIVEKIEANDEVCPNLYFLGKRGTLKTSEGIRISALGGKMHTDAASQSKPETNAAGKFQPTYTEADARALFGTHSADILITNQWPKGIRTGSKVVIPEDQAKTLTEVPCLSEVAATLKPRYHFSSSDEVFYEREPFFHLPTEDSPDVKPLTRFISMAPFGSKQKSMYAFTLDLAAAPPLTIPAGATASPFRPPQTKRKGLPAQRESFKRFATDDDYHNNSNRPQKRHQRAPPPGPDQSTSQRQRDPSPPNDLFTDLGFPGHMLIIPFSHTPTLNSISDPESRAGTYAEMQHYRAALHQMLSDRSSGKLGAVTWEVSRGNGIHTHWQFLPVPVDLIDQGLVEAAFKVEAENLNYPRFETKAEGLDSSAEPEKTLMLELNPDFRFDIQFGRRVMAKLLELDKRMNWKDATQSQPEEEADAEAFKEAFKKYDFSME